MTASDNKWQQMTMGDAKNDNKYYNNWKRATTSGGMSDNEWQLVATY